MKFVMERGVLLRALGLVGRTVARRNTIPILSNTLIAAGKSGVTFAGTDMDRWLSVEAETVSIGKAGATTANVANLTAFVRSTPDGCQVEAELKADRLVLRAGRAKASLQTLAPADFPAAKTEDYTTSIDISGKALGEALDRVAHAQSNEETRYYLNGVYTHVRDGLLRLVATDGHRLAWTTLKPEGAVPEEMPGIIVPRQATADLQTLAADAGEGNLTFEISTARLKVTVGNIAFETKLIDGTFPDYDRVIPSDNDCGFQARRADFESAVARCAALTSKESRAVKLTFAKGLAQLSQRTENAGDVEDELEVELRGKPAETGFNSSYMAQALAALDSDSIDIEFTPGGPILLRDPADRDGQLQVVMAMRV
jgi:DNA polymerase-3 subunit beta